jgi:prolyl oligopeptidase
MVPIIRFRTVIVILLSLSCSSNPGASRWRYPVARTVNVVDDYHGTKISDPYRWLEDLESEEVRRWAAAQNAIALPMLRENSVRHWVLARVAELEKFWADPPTETSNEPPLIDESALGSGKTLSDVWPSPDGRHAAYAVSDLGSEWVETRIRRLSDGKDLDERLEGMLWSDASWTKDGRGFFYVRSRKPAPGERTLMKGPAAYYHVIGTPQSADVAVFQTPRDATDLVVTQAMSDDGRFLFIYEGNGASVDGLGWLLTRMHVLDLADPGQPIVTNPVTPLTTERDAAYRVIATSGDTLYVFTDHNAPRRRLVAIDIKNPVPALWRDVIAQTTDLIDQVSDMKGYFVVTYVRDVQHGVRVYDRTGRLVRDLSIPPMSTVEVVRPGERDHELVVEARTGFAPTRTRYDLNTGAVVVEKAARLPASAAAFEIKQVWYASKDGVRVPMFLLHRRGMKLNGSHPAIMVGYGASSQLTMPFFNEWTLPLLELGLVIALPVLRGGGEFGRTWYEAAILERKQTTFDDFIAAAEYLMREGYTSREKLAIIGASNGGLLVAAVINQRPELFRAAIAGVPQTDALRYDRGRHNPQFGIASNPAHFPYLHAYSPQHNIKPGTCYPATLITTALNDDRAPAWMALKYTAALQAAQSCNHPILLRADTAGGHIGNWRDDAADNTAFVAVQLGLTVPKTTDKRD